MLAQGPSLSPYDLKESFLEKRAAFRHTGSKTYQADEQAQLDRIEQLLAENAPNSFEFHLVKYINGRHDFDLASNLMEAERLQPDNAQLVPELFAYHYINGNQPETKTQARKILRVVGQSTIEYYQEMVADPAVTMIILSGEQDALPALALQEIGKIRSDVKLINLDFLLNASYLKEVNATYGLGMMKFLGNEKKYISALLQNAGSGAAISTTVHQAYLSRSSNQIFITGLVYRYKIFNQILLLDQFWKRAQKDLKDQTFANRSERKLYRNYIPPLLTYYQLLEKGRPEREQIRKTLEKLTSEIGQKKEVEEIIKAYDQNE